MNPSTATGSDSALALNALMHQIQTRNDFRAFLRALLENLRERPEEWENPNLPDYLEALGAWTEDMEGYYQNRSESIPTQPTWKVAAQMLLAAKVYE